MLSFPFSGGVLCMENASRHRRRKVLAKAGRKKTKVKVKDMKFRHDPMIRFYEKTQDWLQERGRPFIIAVGIIAGLAVLYVLGSGYFSYRSSKAAAQFGVAFEKYNAPVQDTPVVGQAGKFYTDEQTKWQETAEAFESLARDYSGYYGSIGIYYAGVARLHLDRDRGLQMLRQVADKNDGDTSDRARLAIAENHLALGEYDQAVPLYEKLLDSPAVAKETAQMGLAACYEKKGETERAVELYVEVAKLDRSSPTGSLAEKRLSALAPDRLKELPPPSTTSAIP
jgi:tetratricopeptide (TPR) repeat protein